MGATRKNPPQTRLVQVIVLMEPEFLDAIDEGVNRYNAARPFGTSAFGRSHWMRSWIASGLVSLRSEVAHLEDGQASLPIFDPPPKRRARGRRTPKR